MTAAGLRAMRELAAAMRANRTNIRRSVRGWLETWEVRQDGMVVGTAYTFADAEQLARAVRP